MFRKHRSLQRASRFECIWRIKHYTIEKTKPDWKASFSAAADLRADVNENAANAAGSSDDALSRSVGRPINIMLFASEVPVIAGLNPYR